MVFTLKRREPRVESSELASAWRGHPSTTSVNKAIHAICITSRVVSVTAGGHFATGSDISASRPASRTFLVNPDNNPSGPTRSTTSLRNLSTSSSASCLSSDNRPPYFPSGEHSAMCPTGNLRLPESMIDAVRGGGEEESVRNGGHALWSSAHHNQYRMAHSDRLLQDRPPGKQDQVATAGR